jgi:hypothetical protein
MDYVRLHRLSHKRLLEHQTQRLKSPVAPEPPPAGTPLQIPNNEPGTPAAPDAPAGPNPFLLTASPCSGDTHQQTR